ncbi:MAG: hypothetical protein Q9167_003989 [Letrouitia subvulpina]
MACYILSRLLSVQSGNRKEKVSVPTYDYTNCSFGSFQASLQLFTMPRLSIFESDPLQETAKQSSVDPLEEPKTEQSSKPMRPPKPFLRLRSPSTTRLNSVPPDAHSPTYSPYLVALAARILYRSPLPSSPPDNLGKPCATSPLSSNPPQVFSSPTSGLPLYVLNIGALPDAREVDYDQLLPYVLARLPGEEELLGGHGWECVVFAGEWGAGVEKGRAVPFMPVNRGACAKEDSALRGGTRDEGKGKSTPGPANGSSRPSWGWCVQAYYLLSRAMRKRLRRLYIVHERAWVRLLVEMFATVGSPKFRKKVVHCSSISSLGNWLRVEDILVPPRAWSLDLKGKHGERAEGRRVFGVRQPLIKGENGKERLPRCLREATKFLLTEDVVRIEGLFRVNARKEAVESLQRVYERGQKFVVWREKETVLCLPSFREGFGDVGVEELELMEGFEGHAAAGLVKSWYRELKEPIFPPKCYQALEKFYGKVEEPWGLKTLTDMLSMDSQWTILDATARKILTAHLLPLLSRIESSKNWNHMTSHNLAVCFAPTLLRSPDILEDTKMSKIVCCIIEEATTLWEKGLAAALRLDNIVFEQSLRPPEATQDREDPLEEGGDSNAGQDCEAQMDGITMIDNEFSDYEEQPPPLPPRAPPLPPRPQRAVIAPDLTENASELRRKPAPAVCPLPRYSVIMRNRPAVQAQRIFSNTIESEGYEQVDDILPSYTPISETGQSEHINKPDNSGPALTGNTETTPAEASVQRKPVPVRRRSEQR